MAKELFRQKEFQEAARVRIHTCNQIINEYMASGMRLTLRQLYYQLVSRAIIPNTVREYEKLSGLVSDARLAGLMDWDAIEDRVRTPRKASEFENMKDLVESALATYRLPRWKGQPNYVELWVEKDALAGVLAPIANKYHIVLMVNRGYSSQSAMYESANRVRAAMKTYGSKQAGILYLGDLDPSGEDMVRDIRERFTMFRMPVVVLKLGLTIEQVRKYNPPTNPAKITDPRAKAFIKKFGHYSWEVDALPPRILTNIITTSIEKFIDRKKMNDVIATETRNKEWLKKTIGGVK